jgi:hypothetical protein
MIYALLPLSLAMSSKEWSYEFIYPQWLKKQVFAKEVEVWCRNQA